MGKKIMTTNKRTQAGMLRCDAFTLSAGFVYAVDIPYAVNI